MGNRLLVATLPLAGRLVPVPGVRLAPLRRDDVEPVGDVYWHVHGGPAAETTRAEAVEDVVRALDGGYGALLGAASLVAWDEGAVAGAVLTVLDPPWPDVPRGPFVIDLFVAAAHRRRGVGELLVRSAAAAAPGTRLGLRVEDDAYAARRLYARLGFHEPDDVPSR